MDLETIVGIAIHIALILLFLILGIVLWKGKGAWMIAGYNTSSKAEKANMTKNPCAALWQSSCFSMPPASLFPPSAPF